MIAKSTILPAVLCLVLAGCGSRAPQALPERDSAVSPAPAAPPATRPGGTPAAGASMPSTRDTLSATVTKAFPSAASVEHLSQPFPCKVIRDRAGRVLGYEAFSDSAGATARGYAGMVPVQVFFDARGRPVRIYVLDNCENPAHMDLVYRAGLLEKLLAFDPASPESIDVVTLATSSSQAIIAGVTGLAARVSAEIVATNRGSR